MSHEAPPTSSLSILTLLWRDRTSLFPALRGIRGTRPRAKHLYVKEGSRIKGRLLRAPVSKRTVDAAEMKSKAKKSLLQVQKTHDIINQQVAEAGKKWRSRRGALQDHARENDTMRGQKRREEKSFLRLRLVGLKIFYDAIWQETMQDNLIWRATVKCKITRYDSTELLLVVLNIF